MSEKIAGKFYTAIIEKSRAVCLDGTVLDYRIEIDCQNGDLFKELIEYIEDFHSPKIIKSEEVI